MSPVAAQLPCCLCADGDRDATVPVVCVLCRAEHTGVVVLRLSHQARADYVLGAIHRLGASPADALGAWADGLVRAAERLRISVAVLRDAPEATEAVALALMGNADPVASADSGNPYSVCLTGLVPSVARRLAGTPCAEVGEMRIADLRELVAKALA